MTVCEPTDRAVVLGSTQPAPAGPAPAGLAVVRRRSGGGAVLVEPGGQVWVDVDLPRGDPLWDDDVGRAAWWLGECWAAALAEVGVAGGEVHRAGLVTTRWSRAVCFAGRGPGEVVVGGAKAVGLSSRRSREGARFSTMVPLRWDPGTLAGVLGLPAEAVADLEGVALAVPQVDPAALVSALTACLAA